MSAEDSCK